MTITIDGNGIITGASTLATTVASPTLTTPNINSAQFATVTGTAPIYPCRAWVNFNGTGTVAIRASGNVSSITDNGTGDYTVNFTTAMPDANYALSGALGFYTTANTAAQVLKIRGGTSADVATSSVRLATVQVTAGTASNLDYDYVAVSIFR